MKNFLLKTWLMTFMLVLGTSTAWADWTRCTAVSDLTSGGTFIIGYEAKANSGVIVPMKNSGGTATTTAAGYMAAFTTGIDMASVTKTEDYEVSIVTSSVKDAVCIKIGDSYLGNTNTKNNCKLFSEESINTAFGVSCGENDVFTFRIAANATYNTLQYNSSSGSERFAVYSATQKNLVVYKKTNNAGAATLQSISIGGDYTKSFYTGDKFYFGGTVTANYSDNSSKDVTAKTEFNGYNPSMVGQQTVTASYTEGEVTKTANYNITVSDFTATAGTYTIDLNKEFYGLQTTGNNAAEQSAEKRGVTVVSGCTSSAGTKTYYDAAHIRYYVDSYLKLTAPAGYVLTKVEFVEPESNKSWGATDTEGITVNAGTYTNSTKTWTGTASNIDFSFSKQCRAAAIIVTYKEAESVVVPTLTSIEVTGTPEALWLNGDFNHNGITVNANWSNGDVTNVTNYCEFTGYDMSVAGDQTVTVTYEDKTTTYTLTVKDNRFASLAALVAAGAPTAEGTPVTVTLTNDVIKSIFKTNKGERRGIFVEVGGHEIEIYCKGLPEDWIAGGTVSGTLKNCSWKLFGTQEPYTWELLPADWSELTYTAPAAPVLYTVTITTPEHGSLVVKNGDTTITNGSKVEAETELSLEATPDVDYEFVKFVATDELGEHGITKTIWTVKGDVTFTAVFQEVLQDPSVTWDLSKYDDKVKADRDEIIWNSEQASMKATIGSSPANNYYPDVEHQDRKKTHFYKDGTFSVTPKNGITITAIKIYSTNDASTKTSLWGESEWSNAVSVTTVENIITIVPTDGKQAVSAKIAGTVGATGVKVYYTGTAIPDPDPVEYKISIEENIVGGTISVSPSTAVAGATITLKATPDDGYKFTSWSVNMAEGNKTVNVTSNRFIMPEGDVVVSAIFTKQEVTPDTPEEHTIVCKDVTWTKGKDENGKEQTLSVTANGYTVLCQKNDGSAVPGFYGGTDYNDVRVYANGSITISSEKPFTSIIFNISTQGLKRLAPITADCGTVATQTSGDKMVIWTSDKGVKSVTFTVGEKADYGSDGSSKAGQLDFTSIDIISAATIGDLVKYIEGLLNKEGTLDELQSIINSILCK